MSAVRPGLVDISSNLGYQGSQAAATGMVISSDGLVLTNNHVITDTTQLYARVLTTGKQYPAKWLGYDSADDVAVIKLVGAHNLQTVPLGNSSSVKLGDHVIAIGNAYGAGRFPAVVGTITGMNRTITASDSGAATKETLHGMLQTNAGIVQGDSGGPLASTAGKVIGMNTAAATGSFGSTNQNVGFAIPIDKALRIARQIISGKPGPSVQIGSTGFLGVLVPAGQASQASNPQQQRERQLKQDKGSSGFPVQPSAPVCLQNQEGAGVPAARGPGRQRSAHHRRALQDPGRQGRNHRRRRDHVGRRASDLLAEAADRRHGGLQARHGRQGHLGRRQRPDAQRQPGSQQRPRTRPDSRTNAAARGQSAGVI